MSCQNGMYIRNRVIKMLDNIKTSISCNRFWVALIVCGLVIFWTGLHNIDNAWNLKYIQNVMPNITENGLVLKNIDADSLYSFSMYIEIIGMLFAVIGGIMYGIAETKREKREINQ